MGGSTFERAPALIRIPNFSPKPELKDFIRMARHFREYTAFSLGSGRSEMAAPVSILGHHVDKIPIISNMTGVGFMVNANVRRSDIERKGIQD